MPQTILAGLNCHDRLEETLRGAGVTKYLLVCDNAYPHLTFSPALDRLPLPRAVFDEFTANPRYEAVCRAVSRYRESGCV